MGSTARVALKQMLVHGAQSEAPNKAGSQGTSSIRNQKTQDQGALKGTNPRGQTEPKLRLSLIFADFCRFSPFLENEAFGKRRFSQRTADFRRKLQKTAGTRRKPQIGGCRLRFVPFISAPLQDSQRDLEHCSVGLTLPLSGNLFICNLF